MNGIQAYLGLGNINLKPNDNSSELRIQSLNEINKFISLFSEAELLGAKALDYIDFCKCINLMNTKAHLTKEGLISIKKIAKNMNKQRSFF
jgi:hypothetical protein